MDLKAKTDEELNEMMRTEIHSGKTDNADLVAILAEKNERSRKHAFGGFIADALRIQRGRN